VSDIETIRWAHEPESVYFDGGDFSHRECRMCRQRWTADRPCDTRVVLDALDRALVAAEGLAEADKRHRDAHEMASWYEDREHAARADADRLAEALRAYMEAEDSFRDTTYDTAIEALRLHDEAERE